MKSVRRLTTGTPQNFFASNSISPGLLPYDEASGQKPGFFNKPGFFSDVLSHGKVVCVRYCGSGLVGAIEAD